MSGFALKLIALLCMLTDHSTFVFYIKGFLSVDAYMLLRGIGRIAFPLFCFLLVQGFEKSSDREGYLGRLMLFALISQLPFCLCFSDSNLYYPVWGAAELNIQRPLLSLLAIAAAALYFFCSHRPGIGGALRVFCFMLLPGLSLFAGSVCLLEDRCSVFYTLGLGLALLCLIEAVRGRRLSTVKALLSGAVLAGALWLIQPAADYGGMGICLILGLWLFRSKRLYQAVFLVFWTFMEYGGKSGSPIFVLFCLLSVPLILLYSGRRGPKMKYFFYAFYPAHLLCLALFLLFG